MSPAEVVVLGNLGVDTNVYLPPQVPAGSAETTFTENLDCVGQAGGYASLGYARLGRRTAFIGHVGDDAPGRLCRDTLAGAGVDLRALFLDPEGTARSVNLMAPDGSRRNFYDGKGHARLHPDPAACRAVLAGARLAHVNLAAWTRDLLPVARDLGLTVACDLQDVVDPGDPYRAPYLREADILFFSSANHGDPGPLIQAFLSARPDRIVVAALGPRGCVLGTRAGLREFPAETLERPVVDTNGAGDSLAVGFLTAHVLEGRSLEASLRRGQLAARHACTLRGTSDGLLTAAELETLARDAGIEG